MNTITEQNGFSENARISQTVAARSAAPPFPRHRLVISFFLAVVFVLGCPHQVLAATGNLQVTAKNVSGSTVQNARVVRYNPGGGSTSGYTDASGLITWNGITTGSYSLEAYYTGTFWGEEYWADGSATVNASSTTYATLQRIYPYIESVAVYNDSSGVVINSTDSIPIGTKVRVEITCRNKVSSSLSVKVRMLLDMSQSSPYDSDQTSGTLSIGSNSTQKYTLYYTVNAVGTWYRAIDVQTTLANGNTVRTDSWGWGKVFSSYQPTGNLQVTVKSVSGSTVQSARVVRYNPGGGSTSGYTDASGLITWNGITTGSYSLEAYYTGTFWGEEYWADGSATVSANSTASATLQRIYPYIESVAVKNDASGATINSTDSIPIGTRVRVEITVRNKVSSSLTVKVRLLLDQSQSSPYDSDQTSGTQSIGSNSTKTYTLTYTVGVVGTWYRAIDVQTTLSNGNTVRTDAWGWGQAFNTYQPTGNLQVTVKNLSGSTVQGARVVRYNPGGGSVNGTTDASGLIAWNGIPTGAYSLEAYYTGTFLGEEYWADGSATVNESQTASTTLQRIYPYIESVGVFNDSNGATISSTDNIPIGTRIRVVVTVRNKVSASLSVRVRLLLDQSQTSPYDSDQASGAQTIGSNSTQDYTFTYTVNTGGTWFKALEVDTTLQNGNTSMTDSWPWQQAFIIVNADLVASSFSKAQYNKGDSVSASFVLTNKDVNPLQNVSIEVHFTDPSGAVAGGATAGPFSINAGSSYTTPSILIWLMPSTAFSGAYLPVVTLKNSLGQTITTFQPVVGSSALPILPMGVFPRLNSLIVRSQDHFSQSDPTTVSSVFQQLHDVGITHLSLSIKLDDGAGLWSALSPLPGQVLFPTTDATPSGRNPLSYDLYQVAQSAANSIGMRVDPWMNTFYDNAALTDNPSWILPANQEGFIDASLSAVRNYESALILDACRSPYTQPSRVTIDNFWFTSGQHSSTYITTFISTLKATMPAGTQLAGYMARASASELAWSGQDYAALIPYMDILSPMYYWQDSQNISKNGDTAQNVHTWVSNCVALTVATIGLSNTQLKVAPTLSVAQNVTLADGSANGYSTILDDILWKRSQLNALGALGDYGIQAYDLFYWGNWFANIDNSNPSMGRWIDRAIYLSSTGPNLAPTDILLSNATVPEYRPVGTTVGTFSSIDPNNGNTYAYSLVAGTGSTDNGSFTVTGNTLQTAASFNYDTKNTYSIRVRSTDQGALFYEKVFTINVFMVTNQLVIRANGQGTISPNYSNSWLRIGRSYTTAATGINGHTFTNWVVSTNWIGGVTNTSASLTFVMQSNLTLQVNFLDTNKPVIAITSPANGQRWSNSVFTVTGTASDNVQVSKVWFQANGTGWQSAVTGNNWTNWTTTPNLIPGTNILQAYAVDAAGNNSTNATVNIVYVVSDTLRVRTVGLGTVSPNYSNSVLEIGKSFSMTATPVSGFVFSNWTISTNWIGGTVTNNATVQFVMTSNLTLQASFTDTNKPTVSITNLAAGQRWSNLVFTVKGTATDNWQVASVQVQLNGGIWTNATGTTNWSAPLTLTPGTNTLAAFATDTTGNNSPTNSVSFVYVVSAPLQVSTVGKGTISPNYSNAVLEIGKSYSMTAAPSSGFTFVNWTGSQTTNGATLTFLMASNLSFTANFADTNKPAITVTSPTAGQRWSNLVFTASGTATDNWQVASVQVQLNGGIWTNATGTTNWSAPLTLTPGTNTLAAFATDTTGNNSPTNSVSWQYVVTNLLTVQVMGLGTISPNYSNSWLEIGRNYSMTATPATGFVVTNWTISTNWLGGRVTNNATVQFMMASNLTLQVNFADVTKPTLTVSTPTANQRMTNALAKLTGTASDNWKVTGVWYQLNSNAWNLATTANSFANWTNTVTLVAGTNTLKFFALDLGGNFSATNSLSIVSSNTFNLQLAFTNALPLKTNGLVFSLQLSKGLNGQIQVSTNLINWSTLTNFVGTNTTLNFRDPAATNSSRRFYRAVIP